MTLPRQERKSLRRRDFAAGFAAASGVFWVARSNRAVAATTGLIVVDERSGLAIYGFDAVAYFTDRAATLGRAEFEFRHAGVVWRFRNPGNRTAFAASPDVYMPCYGGHDPTSIGRGASAPGHPQLWQIAHRRLYLFYSEAARTAFADDPDRAIAAAERQWPQVKRTLVP